jgi:Ca2+-binding RTX toxin-like protein
MATITLSNEGDVYSHLEGDGDTIFAFDGNDTISTQSNNVEIHGGGGNDRLESYGIDGWLDGGDGDDTLLALGSGQMLCGGAGDDVFIVVSETTTVCEAGQEGTDTVETTLSEYWLGGNFENLTGTSAAAQILGGNDLDNVITGSGGDTLRGECGDDTLIAAQLVAGAPTTMQGGSGDDLYVILGQFEAYSGDGSPIELIEVENDGIDTVHAALLYFELSVNFENITDTSAARSETTTFIGNAENNVMTAGVNRVAFFGQAGDDTLTGGDGDDVLDGGSGFDQLYGGAGSDVLTTRSGGWLDGGAGDDCYHIFGNAYVYDESGHDRYFIRGDYSEIEDLDGGAEFYLANSAYETYITGGNDGNFFRDDGWFNTLTGGSGKDSFVLNGIYAEVDAKSGDDIITVSANSTGHVIRGGDGRDTFTINGHGNQVFGDAGDDIITGRAGQDALSGGAGNDRLTGGAGKDSLHGGAGADRFIYNSITEGGDVISAFDGNDLMVFRGAAFARLKPGMLDQSMFRAAASHVARDWNDYVLFDTRTDTLWFDADGNRAGAAKLVADFSIDFAFTAADILII